MSMWPQIIKAVIAAAIGAAAGGGGSLITDADALTTAVNSIVTGAIAIIGLFKRSPKDEARYSRK